MKRFLRWSSGFVLLAYLGLGVWFQGRAAPPPQEAGLPMAAWGISRIEAQNRQALPVLGSPARRLPTKRERFLPDLKPLSPYDIYTVGSHAEGDLRLKFATMIHNAGQGPLETRGSRNPRTGRLEVYQYVYEGEGTRAARGQWIGTFDYDHRHGHLHFANFAHYELWSLSRTGELLEPLVGNAKVGFCLMDIKNMASGKTHLESGLVGRPAGPVYAGCREDIQGISVGWGDEYVSLLYEQDLDLTGIPGGRYALVITSNPDRQIEELDYENNRAVVYVTLTNEEVAGVSEKAVGGG